MASVNKVILVGNLGKDPEIRYLPNGDAVCNFSLATTRSWKDKTTGDKAEETEWHRISTFGKLAEIAGQYLKKGSSCYLEGRLKTRKWQDKEGKDNYTTEVIAESLQMLGGRSEQSQAPTPAPAARAPQRAPAKPASNTGFDSMHDDPPF